MDRRVKFYQYLAWNHLASRGEKPKICRNYKRNEIGNQQGEEIELYDWQHHGAIAYSYIKNIEERVANRADQTWDSETRITHEIGREDLAIQF